MPPIPPLTLTPELRDALATCVWFEPPEKAVAIPARAAAYILTYGLNEQWRPLLAQLGPEGLLAVLEAAPPGIYDARSWAYWNLRAGRYPTPPMPQRTFKS
jgi:hypothetical protein